MKLKKIAALIAIAGLSGSAFATNGYFAHGYGMKSKGMGGVGIAYGQDALAAATNPANMVLVGNRWDVGVDYFRPQRESKVTGFGTFDGNDSENYFVPEFGYNKMVNNNMSFGVSVYGNGGMATDYGNYNTRTAGTQLQMGTAGKKNGVDLAQLFIAPTLSYKLNENHAVGVTLKIAYQSFEAFGLQNFTAPVGTAQQMSASPTNVTNNNHDGSWGYGLGLGWTGQISPTLSLGATYQSRTYMQEFDNYKGLFAEQGDFDIPENYGVGFAWKATPQLLIAGDIQQINYGDVKSIANKGSNQALLGSNNGPGFGWDNMTVYKLGVAYDFDKNLTLRGGYSWADAPYGGKETFFNILAPGLIEEHLTLGATYRLASGGEVTVSYMHAFENTVNGKGANTGISNTMYQDSLGVAYGVKF
jgi:long-chain fatty acid transport protein